MHAACYDRHLRAHEAPIRELLGDGRSRWCRSCLVRKLGIPLEDVYAVSARLLAQRAIRTAAGACTQCRHPRLVLTAMSPTADS
jgi:hypothetical protein